MPTLPPCSSEPLSLDECIQVWRGDISQPPEAADASPELKGDGLFGQGKFEEALAQYECVAEPSPRLNAKQGWCLAVLDRCDEAAKKITAENAGSGSAALAMLAFIEAGGWEKPLLRHHFDDENDQSAARRTKVRELIDRALDTEPPDYLAFLFYQRLTDWYSNRTGALMIVRRAVSLFPKSSTFITFLAFVERTSGDLQDSTLGKLAAMPGLDAEGHHEMLLYAIALGRRDEAQVALAAIASLVQQADPLNDDDVVALEFARVYVDLRCPSADTHLAFAEGLRRISVLIAGWESKQRKPTDSDKLIAAYELALVLAVKMRDAVQLQSLVSAFIRLAWLHPQGSDFHCHMLVLNGHYFEIELGHEWSDDPLFQNLPEDDRIKWNFLRAVVSIASGEDGNVQDSVLSTIDPVQAPRWAQGTLASFFLRAEGQFSQFAGRALGLYCAEDEAVMGASTDLMVPDMGPSMDRDTLVASAIEVLSEERKRQAVTGLPLLECLADDLWKGKHFRALKDLADCVMQSLPEHPTAIFYAALARQDLAENAAAIVLYERLLKLESPGRSTLWNLALLYGHNEDVEGLERLRALVPEDKDSKEWKDARAKIDALLAQTRTRRAGSDLAAAVRSYFARGDLLRREAMDLKELSLGEAAALVALLRACELDHARWVLDAFGKSQFPFEPTDDRFVPLLTPLIEKGVIRIAESTPLANFSLKDGRLFCRWHQVRWGITPHTLALQQSIRSLARSDWPEAWLPQIEILARDLAVEECVAYLEYLAEQRDMDPPERTDARPIFRELLEHASAAQCWYYIYSGIQSANDYRSKYPVSRQQVTAMILRRIRERGMRAISEGWDTKYQRISALPRSHFSHALHDLLTGWGEAAFDNVVRTFVPH